MQSASADLPARPAGILSNQETPHGSLPSRPLAGLAPPSAGTSGSFCAWSQELRALQDRRLPIPQSVAPGCACCALDLLDGSAVWGEEPEFEEYRLAAPSLPAYLASPASGTLFFNSLFSKNSLQIPLFFVKYNGRERSVFHV